MAETQRVELCLPRALRISRADFAFPSVILPCRARASPFFTQVSPFSERAWVSSEQVFLSPRDPGFSPRELSPSPREFCHSSPKFRLSPGKLYHSPRKLSLSPPPPKLRLSEQTSSFSAQAESLPVRFPPHAGFLCFFGAFIAEFYIFYFYE